MRAIIHPHAPEISDVAHNVVTFEDVSLQTGDTLAFGNDGYEIQRADGTTEKIETIWPSLPSDEPS